MKKVIIESPYAGDIERNIKYARVCLKDSLFFIKNIIDLRKKYVYLQYGNSKN